MIWYLNIFYDGFSSSHIFNYVFLNLKRRQNIMVPLTHHALTTKHHSVRVHPKNSTTSNSAPTPPYPHNSNYISTREIDKDDAARISFAISSSRHFCISWCISYLHLVSSFALVISLCSNISRQSRYYNYLTNNTTNGITTN